MSKPNEFTINEFITMKLEYGQSNIYVKGRLFTQCKYLLLDVPIQDSPTVNSIDSIDEAAEKLDHSMEFRSKSNISIPPEIEFWGHCSNIQAWVEHEYDTRILHRNLAFPLLRALTDVGDEKARKVFKEEIALRLERMYLPVMEYLVKEGYLNYLTKEEYNSLDEIIREQISQIQKVVHVRRDFGQRIRRVVPRTPPNQDNLDEWLTVVEEYISDHQYRNAVRELERLLESVPENQDILVILGDLYYQLGQRSDALKVYLDLLRQAPDNLYILNRLGIIYYSYGLKRSTFRVCLKILEIDAQYFKIFGLIRDLALDHFKKAFEYMRKFIHDQIRTEQFECIYQFLNEECLMFFTLEELEQIFDMVDVSEQALLREVNRLIIQKRIINSLKARKSIKITEERIRASYSDF